MALLFDKNEPQLLPEIVALSGDSAPTFPTVSITHAQLLPYIEASPQTVGGVARAVADFYIRSSDYDFTELPSISWSKYWATHASRPYCLSWLRVRMKRATGGVEPVSGMYRARLQEFRRTLEHLPSIDRDLYLLWLVYETDEGDLATEAELLAAARRLGSQRVLQVVGGHPPSDDPDLDFSHLPNWPNLRPISFLLLHADKTMSRADVPALESIERRERLRMLQTVYRLGPEYAIARARLQPEMAEAILRAALREYPVEETRSRTLLSAALRELADHRK
jgi:hypothetical protein